MPPPKNKLFAINAVLLMATLLLSACQPDSSEAEFANYLSRLSRSLDTDPTTPVISDLNAPPRSGQLRITIAPDSLGTLDFLKLHGCELQVTIGKRNSSLGKLARDSQRLLLELEFLRLAPSCIKHLQRNDKNALAETLQQAWQNKQQQLKARIFNATLAATEFQSFWQGGNLQHYPEQTSSAVITTLDQLNHYTERWLSGNYLADNAAFELMLSEIAKGDGGLLWHALAEQDAWLAQADKLLYQQAKTKPLCGKQLRREAADTLPIIVRRFFIGDIQPRAASLGQRYHQLLPAIRRLEQQLDTALPANYRLWQQQRDQSLQQLAQAPKRHVAAIKSIMSPCGDKSLMP